MIAYCYASGQIEIGRRVPKGALSLRLRGPRKKLEDFLAGCARLAYDNDTWLVPGVPEAPNQKVALDALFRFCERTEKSAKQAGLA
jgi:hypothetical protein